MDNDTIKDLGLCPICQKGHIMKGSLGYSCNYFKTWMTNVHLIFIIHIGERDYRRNSQAINNNRENRYISWLP